MTSWIKLLTRDEVFVDIKNNKILTQELIEECRKFKEDAIQKFREIGKKQDVPKLTSKKAEIIFWFLIFRIFVECDYKADTEGNDITSKFFCTLVGKGISHNTLDTYNNIHSQKYYGAPGDIEINDSRIFINVNTYYRDLHGIISKWGE